MKGILYFSVIAIMLLSFSCQELNDYDEDVSLKSKAKLYYNLLFSNIENALTTLDNTLSIKFSIKAPYNLVAFFLIGCFIKIVLSCLFSGKRKDNYVYNKQDTAEGLYNIINVIINIM